MRLFTNERLSTSIEWHPTQPKPFHLRSSSRGETSRRSQREVFDELEAAEVERSALGTAQSRLERFKEAQKQGKIPKSLYLGHKKEKVHHEPFALSSGRAESPIMHQRTAESSDPPTNHGNAHRISPSRLRNLAQPRNPLPSVKSGQTKKGKAFKLVPLNRNAIFDITGDIRQIEGEE